MAPNLRLAGDEFTALGMEFLEKLFVALLCDGTQKNSRSDLLDKHIVIISIV